MRKAYWEGRQETTMTKAKQLDYMPFDMSFVMPDGNEELCHATGTEVLIDGEWWNEYVDQDGNLHYGR